MRLPNVRNVNKGKRKKKKHHYKVGDFVAVKWIGEKQLAVIDELDTTKNGIATYKVRSISNVGCSYSGLELDDPEDPYCYVSSILTKSLSDGEIRRIKTYEEERVKSRSTGQQTKVESQPDRTPNRRTQKVEGLKEAIDKQKDFINGKKFW
ncbi:hypothetical protein N9W01_00575 [bacterium]|jgi:hypothetical protein|nr:hypothetical protein [bacterium]